MESPWPYFKPEVTYSSSMLGGKEQCIRRTKDIILDVIKYCDHHRRYEKIPSLRGVKTCYTFMDTYTQVYIHTHTYIHTCIHTYINIQTLVCLSTYIPQYINIHICMYTYISCMCSYTHACLHAKNIYMNI